MTRLIFAKGGIQFDDDRIEFKDWPARKDSTPMGQLPVLNYKGREFIQSLSIAKFAARKCGLVGDTEEDEFYCDTFVSTIWLDILQELVKIFFEKDEEKKEASKNARRKPTEDGLRQLARLVKGDFVLGDAAMSYADLALLDAEPWIVRIYPDLELPEKLKSIVVKVKADPEVAPYLASRPITPF